MTSMVILGISMVILSVSWLRASARMEAERAMVSRKRRAARR
jgi:hypothetical protein